MIRSLSGPFVLLLSALLFAACCPEDPFIPTNDNPTPIDSTKTSFLRVIIADPNIDPVNVTLDGEPLFSQSLGFFDYPEDIYEAQFWRVDSGTSELAFTIPGQSPLATQSITLQDGSYHTAYLFLDGSQYKILLTTDDPTNKPGPANVRYRIVNLAVGAPTVDVRFANDPPVVQNLAYGDTTEILTRTAGFVSGGMTVTESQSDRVIFQVADILLSGDAVITLVLGGKLRPLGDERLVFLSIFQDSRFSSETQLYGGLPLPFELLALRFINLIPTGDSTLDLTLYDEQFGGDFPQNFRRNFPNQREATINVAPLGTDSARSQKGYFFLSTFLYTALPYRVEITNQASVGTTGIQTVLVPRVEFPIQSNRRYTVVAYGPFAAGQAKAVTIFDRVPPPSAGQVGLRFFHGDYQAHQTEQLQIRVNGMTSPLMSYGEAPDPLTQSFEAPAGSGVSVDVLNPSGFVIHTESGVNLKAGTSYTFFLSRGPSGTDLELTPIAEEVIPQ